MSESLVDYISSASSEMCISQSAFVNMCIAQYRKENEAMEAMKKISSLNLEDILKVIDNK